MLNFDDPLNVEAAELYAKDKVSVFYIWSGLNFFLSLILKKRFLINSKLKDKIVIAQNNIWNNLATIVPLIVYFPFNYGPKGI